MENKDKAEQFAKTYRGFSKLTEDISAADLTPEQKVKIKENTMKDRAFRRRLRLRLHRARETSKPIQECEQDIQMHELERVLDEAANNKAAGEDEIPYEFLKWLGPKARQLLLFIYNKVWSGKEWPVNWRRAVIIALLKDGKDPKDTTSYRPISLLSCMSKLLEKIIANRLLSVLESRGAITNNQAGFRQNRCTTDQVLRMVQEATDHFQEKGEGNTSVSAYFDYAKAYDKVWRAGLLHKMMELEIPYRFIKFVRNFLSGRRTRVDIGGERSSSFRLDEGLPQGSSISPILFIIFINDIDVGLDPRTIASLFADDTSLLMKDGVKKGSNHAVMEQEIDKILAWAEKWKMKINVDKTRVQVISSSNKDLSWDPNLTAKGEKIETTPSYKFLGVTTDGGLRFTEHVKTIAKKARARIKVMKCMAGKDWGNSVETQRQIFIQTIRTLLEYGSPAWSSYLCKTTASTVQRIQNQGLRAIYKHAKTTPVDYLHLEAGVEPILNRWQKIDDITWDRYARLPDTDPRKELLCKDTGKPRLSTRFGWRHETAKRMKDWDIPRDTTTPPLPPWREMKNLTLDRVKLDRKKGDYSPEELKQISQRCIDELETEIIIWTDGSTAGDQRNGGAGFMVESRSGNLIHEESHPAGKLCSSYTGECIAMLRALQWIQRNSPKSCTICTDSLSLHQSLAKDNWRDKDEWLKQVKRTIWELECPIHVLWIPSHCGIRGNERADALAEEGTHLDQSSTPVSHSIIKAKIKARKWEVSHKRAKTMYGERRKPKFEEEKSWPKKVRTLFSKLRTGHSTELKRYRFLIEKEDDPICNLCEQDEETIEHILCECPALEEERVRQGAGHVTPDMMVTKPELCRKILVKRFKDLNTSKHVDNEPQYSVTDCSQQEGTPFSTVEPEGPIDN